MKTFFRIYRDRFWRLTLHNLVYFCVSLPLLLVLYICVNAYTGINVGDAAVADVLPGLGFFLSLFSFLSGGGRALAIAFVALSALLYGPMKFVLYHVEISYLRGDYRFFADSLAALKRKLPQALLLGVLDLLVLGRTVANLCGLYGFVLSGTMAVLLRVFSFVVLLFWLTFRRWFFLLAAACELRLRDLLKDSFLLSVSGLGRASQCTAACVLIWAVTFLTLPLVTVVLLPLVSYAAASLATVCSLYPLAERQVLRGGDEKRPPEGGSEQNTK